VPTRDSVLVIVEIIHRSLQRHLMYYKYNSQGHYTIREIACIQPIKITAGKKHYATRYKIAAGKRNKFKALRLQPTLRVYYIPCDKSSLVQCAERKIHA
jgi:hypothetical protein